jgi:hypothetical protein
MDAVVPEFDTEVNPAPKVPWVTAGSNNPDSAGAATLAIAMPTTPASKLNKTPSSIN